jgi:hypothetical protein
MTKQQIYTVKLKSQLEISQAETELLKAQFIHLNRLQAANERLEHVKHHIRVRIIDRLEDAENMIFNAKRTLGKAQAKYRELMASDVQIPAHY